MEDLRAERERINTKRETRRKEVWHFLLKFFFTLESKP